MDDQGCVRQVFFEKRWVILCVLRNVLALLFRESLWCVVWGHSRSACVMLSWC